jgi:hypothetical protein
MPLLTHYLHDPKHGTDYSILLFAVNGDFLWHWSRTPFRAFLLAQAWTWLRFDKELYGSNRVADLRLYRGTRGDEFVYRLHRNPQPERLRLAEVESWKEPITGKRHSLVGAAYHVKGKRLAEDFSSLLDQIGVPLKAPERNRRPYFGWYDKRWHKADNRYAGLGRAVNIGSAREYDVLRWMQMRPAIRLEINDAELRRGLYAGTHREALEERLKEHVRRHNDAVLYLQSCPTVQS